MTLPNARQSAFRVGIDYRSALRAHSTGVGRYVRELVPALSALPNGVSCALFHDGGRHAGLTPKKFGSHDVFARNGARIIWEEAWLPIQLVRQSIGVYHSPHGQLPFALPRRLGVVLTVHDVIHRVLPETLDPMHRLRLDTGLRYALRRAHVIIADSHRTANDIASHYGYAGDPIRVVHPGLAPTFQPINPALARQYVSDHFHLTRPFILYVGGFGVRKNVGTLLNAFAAIRSTIRQDIDLVLTGTIAPEHELVTFVQRVGLEQVVHFVGYVRNEDLPALYSAASAFAYPSLYEGFGYPVLEAMACGTPVLCSNTSSLPEVAGSACILIAPSALDAWAHALRRLLESAELCEKHRKAGLPQAAQFSVEREAAATLQSYHDAWQRAGS